MTGPAPFRGYSAETLQFLKSLKKNNDTAWFKAHRAEYDLHVLEPSKAFVSAMGKKLKTLSPNIQAIPKINKSLFRINRDTRFSPDKSPYKNHIAAFFWEGTKPRMECSGYYFHMEANSLMLGVGVYMFPRSIMERYRKAAADPDSGSVLTGIIKTAVEKNGFDLGGSHYKRVPLGYEASHPNAELLKHNGLYAGTTVPVPNELFSGALIEFCLSTFSRLAPLHRWLVEAGIGSI